jgi:type II secretory pathway pseudopilin PulG
LLVLVIIIAVSLVILIPIVNAHRETQRRATCLNNVRQIGLGMANYASTFNNSFPPSAQVIEAQGGTRTVGGYSSLAKLMPFMEDVDVFYSSLPAPMLSGIDPEDISNQPPATQKTTSFHKLVALMNSQPAGFICPSVPRRSGNPQSAGITNYKAMGASTRGSLVVVVNPEATPPYGSMTAIPHALPLHPDGAMFPGVGTRAADVLKGLSHTIFTIETIDEAASRWIVGREATLVGLPQKSSPVGSTPQSPYNYFAPPGFDNTYGPNSAVAKAGLRTFLSYDFSPTGADAGKYEDPGFAKTPPTYGPSSMHPEVVICGMGDGSTQAISKQTDVAALFFLITKSNNDPFCVP